MELTQKAQTTNSCINKKSKSKYKSHKRKLGVASEAVGDLSQNNQAPTNTIQIQIQIRVNIEIEVHNSKYKYSKAKYR